MEKRFTTLAPEDVGEKWISRTEVEPSEMESGVRLMYSADEGDSKGVEELLDSGVDINFRDVDQRTALHVAACQGHVNVVEVLLQRGAQINAKDHWGSTPLADALYYKRQDVVKLLESYGAKSLGTFRVALWRGIQVAVKTFGDDVITDDKVKAFREEVSILEKIRHPNVIQFLGAVMQSTPMMIVLEYLPKGDLHAFLNRKGALKPSIAVKFALDIARNILRDDSGHLKVADFGLGKAVKAAKAVKEDIPVQYEEAWRYMAPEVFKHEEYDAKVDVFSFALILQEMIEGSPPFSSMPDEDVPKAYIAHHRPPFQAPSKNYAYGLKELIEQCWNENAIERPTFRQIIDRLEVISVKIDRKRKWKIVPVSCFKALESLWKRNHSGSESDNSLSLIR
ncbi:hypothetical protein Ancab_030035 [Ancistrocladus abbreviatus]